VRGRGEELILGEIASHKYTLLTSEESKFVLNMTSDENLMEVRRNWDMLMPRKFQDSRKKTKGWKLTGQ
jgi:hypothetical protein